MTECPATMRQYDHTLAREGMSDADRTEILMEAHKQYKQALKGEQIDCAGCDRRPVLLKMYRCYFCGRYYCPACAKEHFGSREG